MKIVVGYDGSEHAQKIALDLARAGLPIATHASVVTGADVFLPSMPSVEGVLSEIGEHFERAQSYAEEMLRNAARTASEGAALIHRSFPDWYVQSRALAASAAWAILEASDADGADLIVVASQSKSRVERFFLGSVSHKVLIASLRSVRIARGYSPPFDHPVRVLLCHDASPDSDAALRAVLERDWPRDTEISVVSVLDDRLFATFGDAFVEGGGKIRQYKDVLSDACSHAVRLLSEAGLRASQIIAGGDPIEVILDTAMRWEADSIFLGAQGMGKLERFVLGSVSIAVAQRAACSVEVVRP